jgi:hypothetical protein
MTHVHIHGGGTRLYVTEITPEIADELTQTGVLQERLAAIRLEEDILAAGIRGDMVVFVDGEKVSTESGEKDSERGETSVALQLGKHYLVIEELAEGRWLDLEIEEPFESSKLSTNLTTYVLMDGKSVTVTEVDYDGEAKVGETVVKAKIHTVIFPDGRGHDVVFFDDVGGEEEVVVIATESTENDATKAPLKRAATKRARATSRTPATKNAKSKGATTKKAKAKRAPVRKAVGKRVSSRKASSKKLSSKKAATKSETAKKATGKKATAKRMTSKKLATVKKAKSKSVTVKKLATKRAMAKRRRGSPRK